MSREGDKVIGLLAEAKDIFKENGTELKLRYPTADMAMIVLEIAKLIQLEQSNAVLVDSIGNLSEQIETLINANKESSEK